MERNDIIPFLKIYGFNGNLKWLITHFCIVCIICDTYLTLFRRSTNIYNYGITTVLINV